jgi:hypothetical protein
MVEKYIVHYNNVRLHSAIGYVAPADKLGGRDLQIFKERDRKLEEARDLRKLKRNQAHSQIMPERYKLAFPVPLTQTA